MFRKFFNYFISSDRNLTRELSSLIGFVPHSLHFYKRAFTHKSLANSDAKSNSKYPNNNERLEFLGDAILDSVTAEYLFKKYPTKDEGFLTQMRSKMVKRKTLNMVADKMGLEVFLKKQGATRVSQTMMGNTFEAFVGAVYLDVGYAKTQKFIIKKILHQYIDVHRLETLDTNYKSQLLEYSQKNQKNISYSLMEHYRTKSNRERFRISVSLDDKILAIAEGFSKKSAEQEASHRALKKMGLLKPIPKDIQ